MTALIVGPVALGGFEVDGGINFGGKQRLAAHDLIGGGRVIDALGQQDAPIKFRGYLSGPDASARAQLIDTLRVQGAPLPLSWDVFYFTVLIEEFSANYRNPHWIPYTLSCAVLPDSMPAAADDLDNDLSDDMDNASGLTDGLGLDLSSASASVGLVTGNAPSMAVLASANGAISGAATQVSALVAGAEQSLPATSLLFGVGDAESATSALGAALLACQTMAVGRTAGAFLARAARNLATLLV